jgi:hypothetical protein
MVSIDIRKMALESLIVCLTTLLPAAILAPSARVKNRGERQERDPGSGKLKVKAMAGNAKARYLLGLRSLEESDEATGVKWLMKAAESGYAEAQDAIGTLHESGRGLPKDEAAAAMWYGKAARQGYAQGATNLGNLYFLGRGVEKNYGEALRWLDLGAIGGGIHSRNSLSWFLATCPDGAFRNGRRAINLLAHVVNLGHKDAVLLDTLAAAYAEAGMMDEAVSHVSEAVRMLTGGSREVADSAFCEQLKRRQECYLAKQLWRETGDEGAPPPTEEISQVAAETVLLPTAIGPTVSLPAPTDSTSAQAEVSDETEEAQTRPLQDNSIQMERIVEKLTLIEELLRPLEKADPAQSRETVAPAKATDDRQGIGAADQTPDEHTASQERRGPLEFSRAFVDAVLEGRYDDAYGKMDRTFRDALPQDQMGSMIEEMYETCQGVPTRAELRTDEKVYGSDQEPTYRFWYDLSNDQLPKGYSVFFTQIVPDRKKTFVCSSFFVSPTDTELEGTPKRSPHPWYQ